MNINCGEWDIYNGLKIELNLKKFIKGDIGFIISPSPRKEVHRRADAEPICHRLGRSLGAGAEALGSVEN